MVPGSRSLIRVALSTLSLLALGLGAGGCGNGGPSGESTAGGRPTHVYYLAGIDLRRSLGNAFDAGLYRLAVMSQPPEESKDLGQELPTGLVQTVSCDRARGPRGSERVELARCEVAWQTVEGRPRTTRYVVRLFPTGCFAAGASPRLPRHRDTTIATFAEHPLNALVSVTKQCS